MYLYVISAPGDPDFYIGKTLHTVEKRFSLHKSAAKASTVTKPYILPWLKKHLNTATIEILEECDNYETLDRREAELVWLCKPKLNTNVKFIRFRNNWPLPLHSVSSEIHVLYMALYITHTSQYSPLHLPASLAPKIHNPHLRHQNRSPLLWIRGFVDSAVSGFPPIFVVSKNLEFLYTDFPRIHKSTNLQIIQHIINIVSTLII